MSVPPKYWNANKKRAKVTAEFNGSPVNDAIEYWEEVGRRVVKHFTESRYSPSQKEFTYIANELSAISQSADASERRDKYFADYFEYTYIPRYKGVRGIDTLKIYNTVLHKLKQFQEYRRCHLTFENINIDFYNRFQEWFFSQGFSRNYFGNVVKVIKQVYKEARVCDKLHSGTGTEHRDFAAPKDTADAVYLTTEELDKIYRLPITAEHVQDPKHPINGDWMEKKIKALKRARGLFLIGCYTGLRVSDFSRLSDAHVGKYITIKTQKTGTPVVIPIHPVVHAIIASGFDLTDTVSDQKLNAQIKELCRLAGITNEVLVNKNVGGKNVEVTLPKYKLISSHTARRSFATNAYKAGVPTIAIMKITGHTKESTFLKYIKVSAEENAELLSSHPFFRGF